MHADGLSAQSQTHKKSVRFHDSLSYYMIIIIIMLGVGVAHLLFIYLPFFFFCMNYTHTNDSCFVFCTMTLTLIVSTQYKIGKNLKHFRFVADGLCNVRYFLILLWMFGKQKRSKKKCVQI